MASIFDGLTMVNPNCTEWDCMWKALANHKINKCLSDPLVADNFDEVWQYMETTHRKQRVFHVFRHRLHPKTQRKEYIEIPASKEYRKEYIATKNSNFDMTLMKVISNGYVFVVKTNMTDNEIVEETKLSRVTILILRMAALPEILFSRFLIMVGDNKRAKS